MRIQLAAFAAAALLALAACSQGSAAEDTAAPPVRVTVTVFGASSLDKAFTEIAEAFAAENEGVDVTFSFEGSATLVDQIAGGAPADVLASADEENMERAVAAKLIAGEPSLFALNIPTLIVPAGNPAGITGLDASLDGTKLVVCADGVPCGNAARAVAAAAGIKLSPVSEESKATDVRGKVESGEADAGIVYVTDAIAAGDKVETIDIAGAEQYPNRYPIAVVKEAAHPVEAQAFIDFVLAEAGQEILASYGFRAP